MAISHDVGAENQTPVPLEEQPMLSTAELSLQPLEFYKPCKRLKDADLFGFILT